jgi:hypothetical protein
MDLSAIAMLHVKLKKKIEDVVTDFSASFLLL